MPLKQLVTETDYQQALQDVIRLYPQASPIQRRILDTVKVIIERDFTIDKLRDYRHRVKEAANFVHSAVDAKNDAVTQQIVAAMKIVDAYFNQLADQTPEPQQTAAIVVKKAPTQEPAPTSTTQTIGTVLAQAKQAVPAAITKAATTVAAQPPTMPLQAPIAQQPAPAATELPPEVLALVNTIARDLAASLATRPISAPAARPNTATLQQAPQQPNLTHHTAAVPQQPPATSSKPTPISLQPGHSSTPTPARQSTSQPTNAVPMSSEHTTIKKRFQDYLRKVDGGETDVNRIDWKKTLKCAWFFGKYRVANRQATYYAIREAEKNMDDVGLQQTITSINTTRQAEILKNNIHIHRLFNFGITSNHVNTTLSLAKKMLRM